MLTTGVRSEVGVKIFGTDLTALEDAARRVSDVVRRIPGASNVYPEQVTSGQYLNIEVDRTAAARYGIGVGDIQQVIETAIGETTLTTTIEGRERFPVRVRYAPQYRGDPQALGQVLAVPFALTGGVYLLWLLGYNFSVAVWVGFIALFGTAVQTAVVMVIYLEEAVERKRLEGTLTRATLRDAVMEGALLRLRPKVMT